jgi:hypothetical protein
MKKLLLIMNLILVCAIFSRPGYSQIDLILGLNKSSITGGESWKDPIGLQVGASMPVFNFSDNLSLRVEANLSMQGAKWVEEDFDLEGKTNLLYLNAPVVVRYQTEKGFFAEAGLQPGILLSAKDKWEDTSEDIKDYMKIFDLSIPIGVGYQINEKFGVGFRVIPGITDIFEDDDDGDDSGADRNLVFALRGTYTLNLKK